ncbi:MAG: LPS assembly lipoprotein LptE [Planctomycetota bacterium]|nr:LPS assembly lipoprotein LptE [Planctomycetota bacterium]
MRARRWTFWKTAGSLAVFLAFSGCYSTRPNLPKHAQSIAVPVFANKTYYQDYTRQVEVEISQQVRQAFLRNGQLKVVDRSEADLVLEGSVIKVDRTVLRADRFGEAAETQLKLICKISLYDVHEAKYLFKDLTLTNDAGRPGSGTYNLRRGESEQQGREKGGGRRGPQHRRQGPRPLVARVPPGPCGQGPKWKLT